MFASLQKPDVFLLRHLSSIHKIKAAPVEAGKDTRRNYKIYKSIQKLDEKKQRPFRILKGVVFHLESLVIYIKIFIGLTLNRTKSP